MVSGGRLSKYKTVGVSPVELGEGGRIPQPKIQKLPSQNQLNEIAILDIFMIKKIRSIPIEVQRHENGS